MKGFTLIELLIVTAFTALLLVFIVPITLQFLRVQNLVDTTNTLMSSLRDAHNQAVFQNNDSAFGVKFSSNSYTLFQGSSYATRTTGEDIVVALPNNVTLSGIDQVVFAKRTGIPNTTGTILLQSGSKNMSLSINQQGVIELL
jgi:Tfp pilus assembly protein FimT